MKLRLLLVAALLGASFAATQVLAAPRGFTVEDMVRMERVGSPVLSPDASKVIYTVRTTDIDKNHGHTEIWLLDLKDAHAAPRRLTHATANSSDPEWSANGDAVYFLSERSGTTQVWRLALNGGEADMVTDLPLDVTSFRLSPRADRITCSATALISHVPRNVLTSNPRCRHPVIYSTSYLCVTGIPGLMVATRYCFQLHWMLPVTRAAS